MMNTQELANIALSRLVLFERGALPLHQLVGDLKGVQDSLPDPAPCWKSDFDRLRFALEEVNAIRLDEEYPGDDEHDDFVKNTVQKLKQLLDTRQ